MILNISWNLCDYKSLEIRDLKYVIRFVQLQKLVIKDKIKSQAKL